MRLPSGSINRYIAFVAVDETDLKTREPTYGATGWTVYYFLDDGVAVAMTTPTVSEPDGTNMPGVYRLLIDESGMTTLDAGKDTMELCVHITHAGMADVTRVIEIYRPETTEGEIAVVSSGAVSNVGTVATLTGHTVQTGDSFARLGAPAGTDVSADIADVPTVSEFNARTILAAAYFDPAADAVANVANVTGGVAGSVSSVTGAVGSVTGAVGSVTGAVASVTAGVTLADDAITALKYDELTAFPIKSADAGLTQIARVGADGDTLETLSDEIALIPTTAMRGTDNAATEAKQDIVDANIDILLTRITALLATKAEMDAAHALLSTPAQVNAEVVDVMKTDTIAELTAGQVALNPTFETAVMHMYMALRNRVDVNTSGSPDYKKFYNNAGAVISKKSVTDTAGDYSEAKNEAGP